MEVTIKKIINSNIVLPSQLYKSTLSFGYPPPTPHLSPPQVHYVINVWLLFSQTSADTNYLNPRARNLHENKTVVKWFISINKYRTSWKFITKISRLWKQYKTPYTNTNTSVNSRPNVRPLPRGFMVERYRLHSQQTVMKPKSMEIS